MSDTITLSMLKVDIQQLRDAKDFVASKADEIAATWQNIHNQLTTNVPAIWSTPAQADTFPPILNLTDAQVAHLIDVLHDMVSRLGTAIDNYVTAEESGAQTFTLG
jgi:hypothetical protein